MLRRAPTGQILESAHRVDREYKVLSALAGAKVAVPIPRPMLLCTDKRVIGSPFYLMEYLQGQVHIRYGVGI